MNHRVFGGGKAYMVSWGSHYEDPQRDTEIGYPEEERIGVKASTIINLKTH
jgi:hypothetical protein